MRGSYFLLLIRIQLSPANKVRKEESSQNHIDLLEQLKTPKFCQVENNRPGNLKNLFLGGINLQVIEGLKRGLEALKFKPDFFKDFHFCLDYRKPPSLHCALVQKLLILALNFDHGTGDLLGPENALKYLGREQQGSCRHALPIMVCEAALGHHSMDQNHSQSAHRVHPYYSTEN